MSSLIVVHPSFDGIWPFAADHARVRWGDDAQFVRLAADDARPLGEVAPSPAQVVRVVALGVRVTASCVASLPDVEEIAAWPIDDDARALLAKRGVTIIEHRSEGYWGQSVAEFALGLTIAALRRIPQTYRAMIDRHDVWDYAPPDGVGVPGARGQQFGDDAAFTSGTVAGKRVRIVGAGNIGSRYASFVHALGADVAAYDPVAPGPAFHRTGARQVHHLDELVCDADIFAPMMPLVPATQGTITADHISALPKGCLVVLVTRAGIVDMQALRKRVLADELALAADVFDVEPLPLGDALLGRHNVVHTPHNAGRTIDANLAMIDALFDQFHSRSGRV